MLGGETDIVLGLQQAETVIGQLHLAAQHVVIGDKSFALQAADILQTAFGLCNVPGQYIMLFIEGKEVKVLA